MNNIQAILTMAGVATAILTIGTFARKIFEWINRPKEQAKEINALKEKHDDDLSKIQTEQALIIRGLLACLKGLSEQGCDGPVTAMINDIEIYLNENAHKN